MKKKILFISSSSIFIENFLTEQVKILSSKFNIYIMTDNHIKFNDDINILNLPFKRKPSLLKDISLIPKVFFYTKKIKPDLIISCTPKIIIYGILINIFFDIKRIHIYTGIYWFLFKGIKRKIFIFIDKINSFFCKKIFFDSKSQIKTFEALGFSKNKLELISNGSVKGVDLKIFKKNFVQKIKYKKFYEIPENYKIILYLGRIEYDKGISILLQSFELLLKKHKNYFLFLVGRDEMNIQSYIKNYDINKNYIKILEHTKFPERYINLSDVVCIPSLREGFGSVAIEASACETPIVASNIKGLSESVIDNYNGLKFKVNDFFDLSLKLESVLENDELVKKLSYNGNVFVKKKYDSQIITRDFYKQITNNL